MAEIPTPGEDLLIGAQPISLFVYGNTNPTAVRDIYRNVLGLTTFRHGGHLAAFKSTICRELLEIEAKAREARKDLQSA